MHTLNIIAMEMQEGRENSTQVCTSVERDVQCIALECACNFRDLTRYASLGSSEERGRRRRA